MSVLPDWRIRRMSQALGLIAPYNEDQLQSSSYDVRLSNEFRVYEPHDEFVIDLDNPSITTKLVWVNEGGFVLHPGEFVLGSTIEVVTIPEDLVARIEGKSSLGRLGLVIHATAGYVDPGFNGTITMEMSNLLRVPIVLRPGKLIAQLSFQSLESAAERPYRGRYQGDMGPAASRYGQERKDTMSGYSNSSYSSGGASKDVDPKDRRPDLDEEGMTFEDHTARPPIAGEESMRRQGYIDDDEIVEPVKAQEKQVGYRDLDDDPAYD